MTPLNSPNPLDSLGSYARFLAAGSAIAHALLEDYCQVVAKLENTTPDEISKRLEIRGNQILEQMRDQNP